MFPDVATFLTWKDFKVILVPELSRDTHIKILQGTFVLISDSQVNGNFMIQHFFVQALKG